MPPYPNETRLRQKKRKVVHQKEGTTRLLCEKCTSFERGRQGWPKWIVFRIGAEGDSLHLCSRERREERKREERREKENSAVVVRTQQTTGGKGNYKA